MRYPKNQENMPAEMARARIRPSSQGHQIAQLFPYVSFQRDKYHPGALMAEILQKLILP